MLLAADGAVLSAISLQHARSPWRWDGPASTAGIPPLVYDMHRCTIIQHPRQHLADRLDRGRVHTWNRITDRREDSGLQSQRPITPRSVDTSAVLWACQLAACKRTVTRQHGAASDGQAEITVCVRNRTPSVRRWASCMTHASADWRLLPICMQHQTSSVREH